MNFFISVYPNTGHLKLYCVGVTTSTALILSYKLTLTVIHSVKKSPLNGTFSDLHMDIIIFAYAYGKTTNNDLGTIKHFYTK